MIVAMRRSVRVGLRAGPALEEFGVEPDEFHLITVTLGGNVGRRCGGRLLPRCALETGSRYWPAARCVTVNV